MKNFTLRTVDDQNKVIEESELTIGEGDILIHTLPENITLSSASQLHEFISTSIEAGKPVISVFHGTKFQVLKSS